MKTYASIGIAIPEILLPNQSVDPTRWAVVACDQFTSQPEYWKKTEAFVGDAPSTLRLIYPEVYLGEEKADERIRAIRAAMDEYAGGGVFESHNGIVYVERETGGKIRKGLVVCLDLECYDYGTGSTSLIRATEGTILDRIPPRMKIREGAGLESPHIMVLIDDADNTVIGPVSKASGRLRLLYDFDLMMSSGRVKGFLVGDAELEITIVQALERLAGKEALTKKYRLAREPAVLLFAMGDGNHSLATAKAIWEKTKAGGLAKKEMAEHPARYALVEIVNVHDPALVFEPIHRVIFGLKPGRDLLAEMATHFEGRFRYATLAPAKDMIAAVDRQAAGAHKIGVISARETGIAEIARPDTNLPVGALQSFLDAFIKTGGARSIDYVHGAETVLDLGPRDGHMGFYLPAMKKEELFRTVILDGALPRKTFSMGEASEKRFYMECRRIR